MQNTAYLIERLVAFSVQHLSLSKLDAIAARNTLLDLFRLAEPCSDADAERAGDDLPQTPTALLEPLLDTAGALGLFDADIPALRVNFEARIMGTMMPRPGEVAHRFAALRTAHCAQAATDYFYDLCIKSNYIRTAQIAKNIQWTCASPYGDLEITINLTKPEKDPKTIALERLQPAAGYPKCMLCVENVGYAGRVNFPARQNHRLVPLTLDGALWYLQYSPYVYYNEHCIILSERHTPMHMDARTFAQLFDFVQQFPHYTCGSNADLPIVGGSILSHTHFQGGRYVFPMQRAKAVARYTHPDYPGLHMDVLHWPVSTLRVAGADPQAMQRFATAFLQGWRGYSDERADIWAATGETPHNTVTPILHYREAEGCYVLDLVPRNNRTSAQFPDGIFHPHPEIHHIKKENIGLIEVMGLAILPARLQTQSALIAQVLTGARSAQEAKLAAPEHAAWVDALCEKHGTALNEEAARTAVRAGIGEKFSTCLEHAGVFRQTPEGMEAFARFLKTLGCRQA